MKNDIKPGTLEFYGCKRAELFTLEVAESLKGVFEFNFHKNKKGEKTGFVFASAPGHPWDDTMWTRDAGVFLRELVKWGHMTKATLLSNRLIALVEKNDMGYYAFPEYFKVSSPASGSETDGTAAIVIGMIMLYKNLAEGCEKEKLRDFLTGEASPIAYIVNSLKNQPFIAGSGEFGGGLDVSGEYYNVVQNNLARLALLSAADLFNLTKSSDKKDECLAAAAALLENMRKYMIDSSGDLIWCVETDTMNPDTEVNNFFSNKGTGLINGVLSMSADVLGFNLNTKTFPFFNNCEKTFENLYNRPVRHELFEEYGIWTQFDEHGPGMSSASYGQGYAIQSMLLLNLDEMAEKALDYLIDYTCEPLPGYRLNRNSKYHFYERYLCPYSVGRMKLDEEGCGALNLVNVAEPLKIARMLTGIDDQNECLNIFPKLPSLWSGFKAENWPVYQNGNVYICDIMYDKKGESVLTVTEGGSLGRVHTGTRVFENAVKINFTKDKDC